MLEAGIGGGCPTSSTEGRGEGCDDRSERGDPPGQEGQADREGHAAVTGGGDGRTDPLAVSVEQLMTNAAMSMGAETHLPAGLDGCALGAEGNEPEPDQLQALLHSEQLEGCSNEGICECSGGGSEAAEVAATQYLPDTAPAHAFVSLQAHFVSTNERGCQDYASEVIFLPSHVLASEKVRGVGKKKP